MTIEIALYQPDIAANTGTLARLCACLNLKLVIIEPAGFAWDDSKLRRSGMDYLDIAVIERCPSWQQFCATRQGRRLVLLTTKTTTPFTGFGFRAGDVLLLGRESAGVPQSVHEATPHHVTIPMAKGTRSLNVSLAGAMVASEALRQIGAW